MGRILKSLYNYKIERIRSEKPFCIIDKRANSLKLTDGGMNECYRKVSLFNKGSSLQKNGSIRSVVSDLILPFFCRPVVTYPEIADPAGIIFSYYKSFLSSDINTFFSFNTNYNRANFSRLLINENASLLKAHDADAGVNWSTGLQAQFKTLVYYLATLNPNVFRVTYPITAGSKTDFTITCLNTQKTVSFDVKTGRQESVVESNSGVDQIFAICDKLTGDPVLRTSNVSRIIRDACTLSTKVPNSFERNLLISYDVTVSLPQLNILSHEQDFLNKHFLPSLKKEFPDWNIPKSVHFTLVGPMDKLTLSQQKDIIKFNLLPLNGAFFDGADRLDYSSYVLPFEKS